MALTGYVRAKQFHRAPGDFVDVPTQHAREAGDWLASTRRAQPFSTVATCVLRRPLSAKGSLAPGSRETGPGAAVPSDR